MWSWTGQMLCPRLTKSSGSSGATAMTSVALCVMFRRSLSRCICQLCSPVTAWKLTAWKAETLILSTLAVCCMIIKSNLPRCSNMLHTCIGLSGYSHVRCRKVWKEPACTCEWEIKVIGSCKPVRSLHSSTCMEVLVTCRCNCVCWLKLKLVWVQSINQ